MQLTLKTDYALRTLMTLASTDEVRSVDWIAQRYEISRNHLAKIAQQLQAMGYVQTVRGRGGGMTLALPASAINVGQLVREFEKFEGFVACMGGEADCMIDGICGLKPALGKALEAFLAEMDGYTLADLLPGPGAIERRLEQQLA